MSELDAAFARPDVTLEATDDVEAINLLYQEKGWSDGLPIIPPTPERVGRMLAWCDRPIEQSLGNVPPRFAPATPLRIAANAVMAGCRPEYFPMVLAAMDALLDSEVNLYGVQATTHPTSTLVLFNGPIARELGINGGHNAFGPCFPANASIGRAVRLTMLNIGGATPGYRDMATQGTPAKFTYCAAENEAQSPWEPYHVEMGHSADTSTVTVIAAEGPHNINDHESTTGEGILMTIGGTMATTGSNNVAAASNPLLALGPEHAATLAQSGYDKQKIKEYLYEYGRIPLSRFAPENIERSMKVRYPERYLNAPPDVGVPMIQTPEDLIIMVIGGAGKHSSWIPTFGGTRAVTRPLVLANGAMARSIGEFRGRGARPALKAA
jgi:hypothetical protein